jgi:uncharacterized protein YndB with AHSA1/START domain
MTEPLTLKARIPAPLDAVRHALTDAAELRVWFAEHAEVRLPDRFEFWGRYTPEGDAPHQRLLHADEHTLRFAWLLDGEETTSEITLTQETPDATMLALSQTHWEFSDVGVRGMLHTFWALAIANLADHLAGRPLTARVDLTSADLRSEVLIDAAREVVYDALVDPAKITRWFGYPFDIDEVKAGGTVSMGGEPLAKILDLDPGRSMATDWGPVVGVTTWELEESGGKTRLTFVQSGFDSGNPPYGAWSGWLSGVAELRRFVEFDRWQPIWVSDEIPV